MDDFKLPMVEQPAREVPEYSTSALSGQCSWPQHTSVTSPVGGPILTWRAAWCFIYSACKYLQNALR